MKVGSGGGARLFVVLGAASLAAFGIVAAACSSFSAGDSTTADGAIDAPRIEAATDNDAPLTDDDGRDGDATGPEFPLGCSDGTREGYFDASNIAACEGAWGMPGITGKGAPATCKHRSGNDGDASDFAGCSAQDLCTVGWHVCADQAEVAKWIDGSSGPCNTGQVSGNTFYATAQQSSGASVCDDAGGANDLFGCGDYDNPPDGTCAPLSVTISTVHHPITGLFNFVLPDGGPEVIYERTYVTKDAGPGGVLCCTD